ncbi:hypothetical protein L1267_17075 [Pseudoalteromonas sp. OFAV1]|uniref:hypothetical protein n=1 Tax=Pseudoalteromonas sp. OFAV1 TaxID=2908892 RepID=UPI001F34C68E|nr:hypothetical protein [Pseudoalteromonas sp. OFAV1]MCF2902091.1 hypothetical protein [Pseudoalteromonas sp. OFAV1]
MRFYLESDINITQSLYYICDRVHKTKCKFTSKDTAKTVLDVMNNTEVCEISVETNKDNGEITLSKHLRCAFNLLVCKYRLGKPLKKEMLVSSTIRINSLIEINFNEMKLSINGLKKDISCIETLEDIFQLIK